MRIAIYSRKSIETDTGESIKNQIKLCKEYFERQGNCTFEVFEDEGFSGGNTNRPSFKRMMELVKIKQFDAVAVYKIDRIARNIVDFVNIYGQLEIIGVKLVSITEGFDPSTPAGKMMMLLLASFAEMERMNIAQRVKDNMRELAKLGRWSGGTPPTGYTTKKVMESGKNITYLELIKESENDIKSVFDMYMRGYSTYQISRDFKAKGLNYHNKTIQSMITNPTYLISSNESINYLKSKGYTVYGKPNGCGFLPYNRRPTVNGKKQTLSSDKFVGVSKHKALIDIGLWIKVQEKLESKIISPHPRESEFTYLTGLIKCKCGCNMIVQPGRMKKDGTRVYYFRCKNKRDGFKCNNKFLKVDLAEDAVQDFLRQFTNKDHLLKCVNTKQSTDTIEKNIKLINKKIALNDKYINNLNDKLMLLSNTAAISTINKIETLAKSNEILKEELLKLEKVKLFQNKESDNIEILYNQIMKFINFDMDMKSKRECIRTVIKQIVWDSDTNELRSELLL